MLQDEINRMERELARKKEQLQNQQRNCRHEWKEAVYDPETYTEPVYSHLEGHGSDPYPVFNHIEKSRSRWKRECRHCGKAEYTDKQRPTGPSKPYFG